MAIRRDQDSQGRHPYFSNIRNMPCTKTAVPFANINDALKQYLIVTSKAMPMATMIRTPEDLVVESEEESDNVEI